MTKTNEMDFMEEVEKFVEILNETADALYNFSDMFNVSNEEIIELNSEKTQEEIRIEDTIAAIIAAPIVYALDGITSIINNTSEKIIDMIFEPSDINQTKEYYYADDI